MKGQSLTEVVIVIAVAIIIVGALAMATIATLRNSQFAKNQAQATKLAQEAIEKVRSSRDRNLAISGLIVGGGAQIQDWQDNAGFPVTLWNTQVSNSCIPCYFKLLNTGVIQYIGPAPTNGEAIPPSPAIKVFNRVILLSDAGSDVVDFQTEKKITIIVSWIDFSGSHESRLTTILRKNY